MRQQASSQPMMARWGVAGMGAVDGFSMVQILSAPAFLAVMPISVKIDYYYYFQYLENYI